MFPNFIDLYTMDINEWQDYQNCVDQELKRIAWKKLVLQSIRRSEKNFFNNQNLPTSITNDFCNTLASQFLSAIDEECMLTGDEPGHLLDFLSKDYGLHLLVAIEQYGAKILTCCNELSSLLFSLLPLILQGHSSEEDNLCLIESLYDKWDIISISKKFKELTKNIFLLNIGSERDDDLSTTLFYDKAIDRSELFLLIASGFVTLIQNDSMRKNIVSCIDFICKCLTVISECKVPPLSFILIKLSAVLIYQAGSSSAGVNLILSNKFFSNYSLISSLYLQSDLYSDYIICLNTFIASLTSLVQCVSVLFLSPCKHSEIYKLIYQDIKKEFFYIIKKVLSKYDCCSHYKSTKLLKSHITCCIEFIFKLIVKLNKILEENNLCYLKLKKKNHIPEKKVAKSKNKSSPMNSPMKFQMNRSSESCSYFSSDMSDIENMLSASDEFNDDKLLNDEWLPGNRPDGPCCIVFTCAKFFFDWFMEEENLYIQEQILFSLNNISLCQCVDIDSYLVLILSRLKSVNESNMDKTLALVCHILATNPFSSNKILPQQVNGSCDETDNKSTSFQTFSFVETINNLLNTSSVVTQHIFKHFACLVLSINSFMQEVIFSTVILPNLKVFIPKDYFEDCFTPVSISCESIVEGFLWLILLYMQPDEHSIDLLFMYNYVPVLRNLAVKTNCRLACKSVEILNQMYKVLSTSELKILKKSAVEISKAHMSIVDTFFIVACELFKNPIETLFCENTVLVYVLAIIDSVYKKHDTTQTKFEKFGLINKCFIMYESLIEKASVFLDNKFDEHFGDISTALVWLQVLIRLMVVSNSNESLKEDIVQQLKKSFLSQQVLQSQIKKHVCLSIFNTSIYPQRMFLPEIKEQNDLHLLQKSQVDLLDEHHKNIVYEEQGYEADEECDELENYHHAKNSVSSHRSSLSNVHRGLSFSPIIDQPWLCITLIKCLIGFAQTNSEGIGLLTEVLEELYMHQLHSLHNNKVLYEQGFLGIIINDLSTVLEANQTGLLKVTGKIISHLTSYSITTSELIGFIHLFKLPNIQKRWLAVVLLEMSETAFKMYGPTKYLLFPVQFNSLWNKRKKITFFQTDTLLKSTNNTKLKIDKEVLKYDNTESKKLLNGLHKPASEVAPIKLQLKSNFIWPDKEVGLSIWFRLKDNDCKFIEPKVRRKSSKINTPEHYTCVSEEFFHLCSFGALNAVFEVWLGSSSGCLQYRWLVSSYGNNEIWSTFDHVIVPHNLLFNVWQHLVVSILVLSEHSTAKIVTFLNGCQLSSVQMKYPSQSVQSQMSLFALIGHGLNEVELKSRTSYSKLLNTGVFMVFQGKNSFMQKNKKNGQTYPLDHMEEPVMNKLKAIYIYSLGPNNVSIENNENLSSNATSHMDSSLNWDSVVFKELSFCMNIITENLVANSIPLKLFENPSEVLPIIKAELQSTLMLQYSPNSHNEFVQYIPYLRTNGKIQHTYCNENDEQHDGTLTSAVLLGNIQINTHNSFEVAINNCGGIQVLIFLHALVAENPNSEEIHSAVLKTIFVIQNCCLYLQREMNDIAGYILINHVLDCTPNKPGLKLLKIIFESICDGQIFCPVYNGEISDCVANPSTTAVVKNVCILQLLIKNWKLLRKAGLVVQLLCLNVLKNLIRLDHPHHRFNLMQFQRAGVVENILMGCREMQQEHSTKLDPSLCSLYVDIVQSLLGKTIDISVLKSLCCFLIATHPTIDTLNLHSPENFYLIPKVFSGKHISRSLSEKLQTRRTMSFSSSYGGQETEQRLGFSIKKHSTSPQVILSQEDSIPGTMQSEVIILRSSSEMFKDNDSDSASLCNGKLLNRHNLLKFGHRRIQSDSAVHTKTYVEHPKNKIKKASTTLAESQEYDIISDSELPSSYEGHEEYLVVDGFIEQKVGSFMPKKFATTDADCFFNLRLGLLELLQSTLKILPENLLKKVYSNILRVEHLLVLVNQSSEKLREIALENLLIYLERGGKECYSSFNKLMGFHLLANILHQHEVTVKIVEICLKVLQNMPDLTKENSLNQTVEDSRRTMIVPCMVLLQGCVQKPTGFAMLVSFFVKILEEQEKLSLLALENGFANIIVNLVIALSNESLGSMNSSWKKECFSHFLLLLDCLVKKTCCTLQMVYFQMYKNVQLSLDCIDVKKYATGNNALLYKTCRFLKYYLIQAAFSIFQHPNSYMSTLWCSASSQFRDSSMDSRRSIRGSVAQNIMLKIRGSTYNKISSSVASTADIQLTFQEILNDAIKLTMCSKSDLTTGTVMFGHTLKSLQETKMKADGDADREFCRSLLLWLFNCVRTATGAGVHSTIWVSLLKNIKDELITQSINLIQHVISPLRSTQARIYFADLLVENFNLLQYMLSSNSVPKTQDRVIACLINLLNLPGHHLTEGEVKTLAKLHSLLSNMNATNISDQILIDEIREIKRKRKEEETEKTKIATKRLCGSIMDLGMKVSKVIVDIQDRERQKLLRVIRDSDSKNVEVRKAWKNLIQHLTQERAPWYDENCYPCSWQLDPTEGPSRMRKRLQRCHLDIDQRFFLPNAKAKKQLHLKPMLSYLFDEVGKPMAYSFKTNDIIRFPYHCQRVTPAAKSAGEFLIGETHLYFVAEDMLEEEDKTQTFFSEKDISISWKYDEIREILKRRYSLQDNALEIFLTSGRTFLLAFKDTKVRDEVFNHLMSRELPNLIATESDFNTLTNRWRDDSLTNFEYLMELNKRAGRSFNDLMQYPVFPFILAEYDNDVLDLRLPQSFRNLSKPIACQDKSKEEKYIENYNYLKSEFEQMKIFDPVQATPPYHYSSHYSNSGTVLHFLVRLPPFTNMFLIYQDNQFDIPDRTFHSISTTWKLSSFISSTDVKELIPEFFFLQEFLVNNEDFNLGVRQNGEIVHDIALPKWAHNPRLFTLIHMQALESTYVSENLHHWIDLVFGYKQTGTAAVKATNVFHPATYFGVDVSAVKDTIHRRALQTMIETYGQTPSQLFSSPHTKKNMKSASIEASVPTAVENILPGILKEGIVQCEDLQNEDQCTPFPSVVGIDWGSYCGSPFHEIPIVQHFSFSPVVIRQIITSSDSLSAFLCGSNACILTNKSLNSVTIDIGMLTWGWTDSMLRLQHLNGNAKKIFAPMRPDCVTCCAYVPGSEVLFVGGESGVINVWPIKYSNNEPNLDIIGAKQNLLGHDDAITSISINQSFSIVVTSSKDKTAIIWDLNRLCYIRSLPAHENSVDCVAINNVSGDIATACAVEKHSRIYVWTINAKVIGNFLVNDQVMCLAFSCLPDGKAVNVIIAGLYSGEIRFWETWTLQPIRRLIASSSKQPITAISFFNYDASYLITADKSGKITVWSPSDIKLNKLPTLVIVGTQ
ncbi:lysosomal-trafficking regulator isoform X1 [Hydra vulgaris]|uniref:lysosomal-trafficking regulator isoform X1 n=1 Tax=Hydra vulgaris TaxID=6087 RepID=UPI0032EA068B